MLSVCLALALAQSQAPLFPLQAQLAGSAAYGATLSLRGQLALSGALGDLAFSESGEGRGMFFGAGAVGFVEQPDYPACTRTCARGGVGPFLRFGFARRSLGDEPVASTVSPDWYLALDLAALYSQQFILVPLAGTIDAYGVRLSATATGPGFTRAFFRRMSPGAKRSPGETIGGRALEGLETVIGIVNHGGVHVELSRQHTGGLRFHGGVQLGAGF